MSQRQKENPQKYFDTIQRPFLIKALSTPGPKDFLRLVKAPSQPPVHVTLRGETPQRQAQARTHAPPGPLSITLEVSQAGAGEGREGRSGDEITLSLFTPPGPSCRKRDGVYKKRLELMPPKGIPQPWLEGVGVHAFSPPVSSTGVFLTPPHLPGSGRRPHGPWYMGLPRGQRAVGAGVASRPRPCPHAVWSPLPEARPHSDQPCGRRGRGCGWQWPHPGGRH